MQNIEQAEKHLVRPEVTAGVTRGVVRLLVDMGLSPLLELTLPNGRRADVFGLDRKGRLTCVEVKSCREDFEADNKWQKYLAYCDRFYFATSRVFPHDRLPPGEGMIIADEYGGTVMRPAKERPMASARRKSLTLYFARKAADRWLGSTIYSRAS